MILTSLIRYENAPALEATWADADGVAVKCQAYANSQMTMLATDLGDDAPQYQELMDEIAATYVPEPPAPPTVPAAISMRQARLALLAVGMLDDVDAAIAALPSPGKEAAQIEWEYATEVKRDSGLVSQLAPALGLSEQDIDGLFIAGESF